MPRGEAVVWRLLATASVSGLRGMATATGCLRDRWNMSLSPDPVLAENVIHPAQGGSLDHGS
jgi:hypothetical protein